MDPSKVLNISRLKYRRFRPMRAGQGYPDDMLGFEKSRFSCDSSTTLRVRYWR
jgi:hypothetical protein